MCELLVAAFRTPRPFSALADVVAGLERYGLGGYGWGVAWLGDDRAVHAVKGLGRYRDEGFRDDRLLAQASSRFLVHLRRPSRLSTVQMADTQPFLAGGEHAWCHNGFLERAEELRPGYADRLHGQADSEVGWQFFTHRLAAGDSAPAALAAVGEVFGGKVNLGYLSASGELAVYSLNPTNKMWRFRFGDGELVTTELHSDDTSLFDLVVPEAAGAELIPQGTALTVAAGQRELSVS